MNTNKLIDQIINLKIENARLNKFFVIQSVLGLLGYSFYFSESRLRRKQLDEIEKLGKDNLKLEAKLEELRELTKKKG